MSYMTNTMCLKAMLKSKPINCPDGEYEMLNLKHDYSLKIYTDFSSIQILVQFDFGIPIKKNNKF